MSRNKSEIEPEYLPETDQYRMYHGTKSVFGEFKTPTLNEEMDVTRGGVIYLTSDIEEAKKYAGPKGYVRIARTTDMISYQEQRNIQGLPRKKGDRTRNVYVALPVNVEIESVIAVSDMNENN